MSFLSVSRHADHRNAPLRMLTRSSRANSRCAGCGATRPTHRCARCKAALFCTRLCHEKSWPRHKWMCVACPEEVERLDRASLGQARCVSSGGAPPRLLYAGIEELVCSPQRIARVSAVEELLFIRTTELNALTAHYVERGCDRRRGRCGGCSTLHTDEEKVDACAPLRSPPSSSNEAEK